MNEVTRSQAKRLDRTEWKLYVGLDVKLGGYLLVSICDYRTFGGGGEI